MIIFGIHYRNSKIMDHFQHIQHNTKLIHLLFVLGILSDAHQTPKVTLDFCWDKLSQGTGSVIMHVQRIHFEPVLCIDVECT